MIPHRLGRCRWALCFLLVGCGSQEATADRLTSPVAASQQALNARAVREQAADEVAAVWLASEAKRAPNTGRMFADYVTIQRWLHQELLEQLQALDPTLDAMALSPAARQMHALIEGLEGEALEDAFYAAQRPRQEAVLQRLRTAELPEPFRAEALRRWGRDLAALKALTG